MRSKEVICSIDALISWWFLQVHDSGLWNLSVQMPSGDKHFVKSQGVQPAAKKNPKDIVSSKAIDLLHLTM